MKTMRLYNTLPRTPGDLNPYADTRRRVGTAGSVLARAALGAEVLTAADLDALVLLLARADLDLEGVGA